MFCWEGVGIGQVVGVCAFVRVPLLARHRLPAFGAVGHHYVLLVRRSRGGLRKHLLVRLLRAERVLYVPEHLLYVVVFDGFFRRVYIRSHTVSFSPLFGSAIRANEGRLTARVGVPPARSLIVKPGACFAVQIARLR